MKKIISLLLIVMLFMNVFSILSLASDSTSTLPIHLDPTEKINMVAGEYLDINCYKGYNWSLELNGVISFNGNRINALKNGTARIQGISQDKYTSTYTYEITVGEPIEKNIILKQGETYNFLSSRYNQWEINNPTIIEFEHNPDNYHGKITALEIGTAYITGTNQQNGKFIYKVTVVPVNENIETMPQTKPSTSVDYDVSTDLKYMVIDEFHIIENSNFYNWKIESDGIIDFDGEKFTALKIGNAKLIGIGKTDLRYTKTYNINVIDSAPHEIILKPNDSQYITETLYQQFNWKVENEEIISMEGTNHKYIKAKAEGTTYLYGTNENGGKYTFKVTVSNTINSTEPKETETTETEPSVTQPVETNPIEPTEDTIHKHKIKVIDSKNATYFTKGHTGKTVCKTCGVTISKGETTAKLKLKTPKVKITGAKKKLTVKYTKVKDATGFEVKYKIGKKIVRKTFNTQKNMKHIFKNLKKGNYNVQVRVFIKQGNKKAYSNWTKPKSVKVK